MSNDDFKLSIKDRIILANQYLILEKLIPENADTYREFQKILERGYETHYEELNLTIAESRISANESKEVMDILDMFWALRLSYDALEDKGGLTSKDIQFEGFDGNNESRFLSYARFLVLTQQRWPEVLENRPGFDLNSHSQLLRKYRSMMSTWSELGKKRNLSTDEIRKVLETRSNPERS